MRKAAEQALGVGILVTSDIPKIISLPIAVDTINFVQSVHPTAAAAAAVLNC
jgi:hypothetical protein